MTALPLLIQAFGLELRPCDDCRKATRIDYLDAWTDDENSGDADAFLCQSCHSLRPVSAWGPWQPMTAPV